MVSRQLKKREKKLIFVDLKAAFDIFDRFGKSNEREREGGGRGKGRGRGEEEGERERREELIERVEEKYKKTKSRVRVRKKMRKMVWTARGVRQRCSFSPILFSVLVVDLEEKIDKVG